MACSVVRRALGFLSQYLLLLVWCGGNAILFWRTYRYYKYDPSYFYLHQMLGGWLCVSRGSASCLNLNCGLILLPMCRCLTSWLRGLFSKISKRSLRMFIDRCKSLHITCSVGIVIFTLIHFIGHLVNAKNFCMNYNSVYPAVNAATEPGENPMYLVVFSVPGVTGIAMMLVLCLITSSSIYSARRGNYDLFWYVHRLFIVFYGLLIFHAIRGILKQQVNVSTHTPGCDYNNLSIPWPEPEGYEGLPHVCDTEPFFSTPMRESWMWVGGPLLVFFLDSMYRLWKRSPPVTVVGVQKHCCDILELKMYRKNFKSRPGQFVLINCPSISSLEWHPYTITSVKDSQFTVHLKADGDWSARLENYLVPDDETTNLLTITSNTSRPKIFIDGPFGSPVEDILKFRVGVCVAGGIGFTPVAALLNHIRQSTKHRLQRLYIFWIAKETSFFMSFADLINDVNSQMWSINKPDFLDVRLHATIQDDSREHLRGDEISSYPFLQRRLFRNRPDWKAVFRELSECHRGSSVGVFCCGPKSLNLDIGDNCRKSTKTKFYFYHESF